MSSTPSSNCLLFHGGGLCSLSNRYLSTLAEAMRKADIFKQIFMGFYSFECLLNPENFIKPWNHSLEMMAKRAYGGFYGTGRGIDLTDQTLQKQAIETCKALGITWIGVAGGDGSCRQVAEISQAFENEGIHFFIPMPLTIDGIEGGYSLGMWPAVRASLQFLDQIAATNLQTRDEGKFSGIGLEMQGRNRNDLLAYMMSLIAHRGRLGGIPCTDIDLFAIPANYSWNENNLIEAIKGSNKRFVVIFSEGADFQVDRIMEKLGRKVRLSKAGYLSQMNESYSAKDFSTIETFVKRSIVPIKFCVEAGKTCSLVFDYDQEGPSIEPIDYWAKLNPRKGQKPTLRPNVEENLKRYIP